LIKNIIARRYAAALIETFPKKDLESLERQVKFFLQILGDEPSIEEFLTSPVSEDVHKREIIELLSKECGFSDQLHNFLLVLIDKERIFFLSDILNEIIRHIHAELDIFDFELLTAHEIDNKTYENIKSYIEKYVKGKVSITHIVNPNIKGGFFAFNDDLAINASIRNNLDALKRKF